MRYLIMVFCVARTATAQSLSGFSDNGLAREVAATQQYNLTRLTDQKHLRQFLDAQILVRVPMRGTGFELDYRIGGHANANAHLYRTARPYTKRFVTRLGAQFAIRFPGRRFVVTSLARTCAYQERLRRRNPNAAPCEKTSHTTGATIDIRWLELRRAERRWMESVMLSLERQGLVQATKELGQPVYHVMVYPPYRAHHSSLVSVARSRPR